jgi:hypothetical protein
MRQARFAPAVSMNAVRMTIASGLAAGLFAVGMLSVPATAAATNNNCSNTGVQVNVVSCDGALNGNHVDTDISDIRVLSGNELHVLEVELDKVFVTVVNLPVLVQINTIAAAVVVILKTLNIDVCQVKVGELGLINTNIAAC